MIEKTIGIGLMRLNRGLALDTIACNKEKAKFKKAEMVQEVPLRLDPQGYICAEDNARAVAMKAVGAQRVTVSMEDDRAPHETSVPPPSPKAPARKIVSEPNY